MEKIQGIVERIVYKDQGSNFQVLKFRQEADEELMTVKGQFPSLHPGMRLELDGEITYNKYGEQFEAKGYLELKPVSKMQLENYLGSGLIKGIGPTYAKKIVAYFGDATLDILELNPSRLKEIPGIGKKKLEAIALSYEKQKEIKDILLFLSGYQISTAYALKIYKRYGKDSRQKVTQDPYQLAEDVPGIGFAIADRIALQMGFDENSRERCKAALLYRLKEKSRQGHVFMEREALLKDGISLIGASEDLMESALDRLILEKRVVLEENDVAGVYLPSLSEAENGIVQELQRLQGIPREDSVNTDAILNEIAKENGYFYNNQQIEAIRSALKEKIMVLTGGPGTGKTTTILGVIKALKALKYSIVLAAPTGRAAKRLSEVAGLEAKTIHRLLEYNMESGFVKNQNNSLEGRVFIIDECSMIDVLLLHGLLKALPDEATLILIGDVDQLPAVGPGNVLKDILDSKGVKAIALTEIFRQAKESKIVLNAHRINRKEMPIVENGEEDDFFLLKETKEERILDLIEDLCLNRLPKKYGVNPVEDIQILVPLKKGLIGTRNINALMQGVLNPGTGGLAYGDQVFRVKDKVMQIRNNYDKRVFNGDIGRIESVAGDELLVDFDGVLVNYDQSELDEIQLAYAITIHKSQGSEYEVVILPLVTSHYILLDKNLLYTAATRAKKLLILIAGDQVLRLGISKEHAERRNTNLRVKLEQALFPH